MTDLDVPSRERTPREKAIKRWTNVETNLLLDYVQNTVPFEQPSARIYYKKFLETSNIDTTWSSVRWKVRNLRLSLNKANGLLKHCQNVEQGSEEQEKVHEKVYKICPYYDRLMQIFGNKTESDDSTIAKEQDSTQFHNVSLISCTTPTYCDNDNNKIIRFPISPPLTNGYSDQDVIYNKILEPSIKVELANKNGLSSVAVDDLKLKFEEERLNREYQIQEKKLKLEELKIRNDFELRKMEIEMNERLARYELELKYNNSHT